MLEEIGRNAQYNIPNPMAIDAEESSGNILQKVSHCWRRTGVAGSLVRPRSLCLAFLHLLWAILGQAYLEKGLSSSCAVFPSTVIP